MERPAENGVGIVMACGIGYQNMPICTGCTTIDRVSSFRIDLLSIFDMLLGREEVVVL